MMFLRSSARRWGLAFLALCTAAGCAGPPPRETPPRLEVDGTWLQRPGELSLAEVSAVDIDSHGHVFVLHRAGRAWSEPFPREPIAQASVLMFDPASGALLASWGAAQLVMPHGLSVDPQDRVWITDVAREQVLRFSHQGQAELAIGRRGVPATGDEGFGRPADVAFIGDRVLVADGYLNNRIAVFDQQGAFVEEWRGEGMLQLPHSIGVSAQRVFVADRENARLQVFAPDGRLLASWQQPARGHVYGVKPMPDGRIVTVEGRDREDRFGAIVRVYDADGGLLASYDVGLPGADASLGHDLAVAADGTIYLADNRGNRVVRFRLPEDGMS